MCLKCDYNKKSQIITKITNHVNYILPKHTYNVNPNICNICKNKQHLCSCYDSIDVASEDIECDSSDELEEIYKHMCLYSICDKCRRGPCMCGELNKIEKLCMLCRKRPCICKKPKICIKCKRTSCICNYLVICMKCKRKPCICNNNKLLNVVSHKFPNKSFIQNICMKCKKVPCCCSIGNQPWCMRCKRKPCRCPKINVVCMKCRKKPCSCYGMNVRNNQVVPDRNKPINVNNGIPLNQVKIIPLNRIKVNPIYNICKICKKKQCICTLMNILICLECNEIPCRCDMSMSENFY